MSLTDPIADMLTRIRNAAKVRKKEVSLPSSRMKVELAKVLRDEGYIKNYRVTGDKKQGILNIALKYTDETVFLEIVKILKATGRDSHVIVTSDHGENHGGVGVGHNPFSKKLRMGEALFAIPYIEGEVES